MVLVSLDRVEALEGDWPPATERWLSGPESERLAGITAPRRRLQFLAGHWVARRQLARCAGGRADEWALDAAAQGPPRVIGGPVNLATPPVVGLSHSGPWVACAVAVSGLLGIDVECPRPGRDLDGLAEMVMHPDELAAWRGLPAAARGPGFYRLWTLKEAWLKSRAEALTPGRAARLRAREAGPGDDPLARCIEAPGHWACTVVAPANADVRWPWSEPASTEPPVRLGPTWAVDDLTPA
ncbi:MAG: 4'-phosphopantetheinyl transferase superfamily protein [Burkholderiaceae bacterium]